ncbi:MAG TPA: indole-3-glycerol phosphate synthase TrpC [Gemmatimonadaceae bacterium]|nr:indole-3-glycerol phosphate synthase TrpC [Gemmatimonadaceae bacterium]
MQVARAWTPPVGPLGRLSSASAARAETSRAAKPYDEQVAEALATPAPPDLLAVLAAQSDVAVIAELKRSSPSRGAINTGLDAAQQVRAYADGGAAAFSILTEPSEFGGTLADLGIAATLGIGPCIRKDFITDAIQLVEARRTGASAALLIARAIPTERLQELVFVSRMLGVEPLVEVRDEDELVDALASGALLIGVNNRNLETLEMDTAASARLLPLVPVTHIAIYESGVKSREDVERAASYGADAVLVGSSISATGTPSDAVRSLTGIARVRRTA